MILTNKMASIYIADKLVNAVKPALFSKAVTNEAIIIGSISKFFIECALLRLEFGFYSLSFALPTYALILNSNNVDAHGVEVFGVFAIMGFACIYALSPLIAGVRVVNAVRKNTIQVLQLA